ncbi:hypothetical protein PspLS_08189 [Pyricularia sp. CBS 133598]|nr:hypothetical protein PspLS_08189 [Pyricularia sp. CBS 133598]
MVPARTTVHLNPRLHAHMFRQPENFVVQICAIDDYGAKDLDIMPDETFFRHPGRKHNTQMLPRAPVGAET